MNTQTGLQAAQQSHPEDDASLLARINTGDERAMLILFDRYSSVVYSVALRVLNDPAAAEAILHEIFMQVWRSPDSFSPARGSLGGWLAVVSRNRSIDALRRKRPVNALEDITLPSGISFTTESERAGLIERVRITATKLPSDHRKTLEMAFFDGLTHTEISEMTGDQLGTVKTRIRGSLLTLRKASQA